MIGYYANEKRFTKTHVVTRGRPICHSNIDKKLEFQFCANINIKEFIECKKCLKKLNQIENKI